jgi:hypothetical protein
VLAPVRSFIVLIRPLFVGLFAFLASFGLAAADSGRTVVVPLDALNGSGETGTATLKALGNKTLVTLKLANGTSLPQPAHFHTGNCVKYGPRPLYPLRDVINGKSTTTIDQPIDKLITGDLIINVHKSYTNIATQAACGIPKA